MSESSFKTYANAKNYWVFSNDEGNKSEHLDTAVNTSVNTNVSYTKYVATKSANLNVRSGAGTNYSKVTSLAKGTQVTVTKVSGSWSYITSPVQGWVSTSYLSSTKVTTSSSSSTTTTSSTNKYTTGTYKVTKASLLNVRSGAGTSYSKKTYKQLTTNARTQNKNLGNYYANGYKKGVVFKVTQVKGNWGKTSSGWVCLDYCTKQ